MLKVDLLPSGTLRKGKSARERTPALPLGPETGLRSTNAVTFNLRRDFAECEKKKGEAACMPEAKVKGS